MRLSHTLCARRALHRHHPRIERGRIPSFGYPGCVDTVERSQRAVQEFVPERSRYWESSGGECERSASGRNALEHVCIVHLKLDSVCSCQERWFRSETSSQTIQSEHKLQGQVQRLQQDGSGLLGYRCMCCSKGIALDTATVTHVAPHVLLYELTLYSFLFTSPIEKRRYCNLTYGLAAHR